MSAEEQLGTKNADSDDTVVCCLVSTLLVVGLAVAVYAFGWWGLLGYAAILYLGHRLNRSTKKARARAEEERLASKKESYGRKRHDLMKSKYYSYVANLISGPGLSIVLPTNVSEEDRKRLIVVLAKYGFEFDDQEIEWLLKDVRFTQEFIEFRGRIDEEKPSTLDDYLHAYARLYAEDRSPSGNARILFLLKLLASRGIAIDEVEFGERIGTIRKQMELDLFEKRLASGDTRVSSVAQVDLMSGYDFERFLKRLFESMGYRVEHTRLSGDQGADLVASKAGEKIVVQAKRFSGKVGNEAVQEAVASIGYYSADRAMVVTSSYFTRQAIELARANGVELVNRDRLGALLDKYG